MGESRVQFETQIVVLLISRNKIITLVSHQLPSCIYHVLDSYISSLVVALLGRVITLDHRLKKVGFLSFFFIFTRTVKFYGTFLHTFGNFPLSKWVIHLCCHTNYSVGYTVELWPTRTNKFNGRQNGELWNWVMGK